MFLKELSIHNGTDLVRKIEFHAGINLIIDETRSEDMTESGNSVGKTTVLRLIDFCLDGSGENLYSDPEFKSSNTIVEKFLKENNIVVTLVLVEDLNNEELGSVEIRRNFLSRAQKIQEINGEKYTNDKFSKELQRLIFKTQVDAPTFKQLKSKNIRDEKNKLVHTIRVLHHFVTEAVYEALHLFWFGIDTGQSKDLLVRERNVEKNLQKRLRVDGTLSSVQQALLIVNNKIDEISKQKEAFEANEDYEKDLARLNFVRSELNRLSSIVSRLTVRKEMIEQSCKELEQQKAEIDRSEIFALYKSANALVPNLQKSFEEVLDFHNEMVETRIGFIAKELKEIDITLNETSNSLTELISEETELSEKIHNLSVLESYESVVAQFNEFYEKKGRLEEKQRLWIQSSENLSKIDSQIEEIDLLLTSKDELIQTRITEFNNHFSSISERLDGSHSLLSAENENGFYKFEVGNIEGNPGTGSKKSQMASFDLAYIKFADEKKIPCLHFILQDQIENVHSNQISNLFTQIVDEVNCQYVLPVLRDKLPTEGVDIEALKVISLSQDEKLFGI